MNPDNPYNREALVSGLAAPIEDWLSKFDREGLEGFLQYILQGWDIDEKHWYGFYWTEGRWGIGWAKEGVPPIKGGSTIGIPSPPAIWIPKKNFVGKNHLK
mgnify:CR=1 FL=1